LGNLPKFYEYLASGLSKPQALRQAKIDFLQTSDEVMSSPYFWSGFVDWGAGNAVLLQQATNKKCTLTIFPIQHPGF
jgi:hypothetical protein